ncbi:unnamed protein product [Ectocarpus sp. CCAP 1310/34]|nr:unnamed protein product [Ectocarpus sp. CCAP 1310/34]
MATVKATLAEKKLMEELEQMKALVEQLRQQQLELAQAPVPQPRPAEEQVAPEPVPETTDAVPATAEGEETPPAAASESGEDPRDGSGGTKVEVPETKMAGVATRDERAAAVADLEESRKRRESMKNNAEQVSRLQEMLEAKQLQLRNVLSGGGEGKTGPTPEERQLEQQKEEYGRRGIRQASKRGYSCCIVAIGMTAVRKHCTVEVKKAAEKGEKGTVTLIGGRGEVLHNGRRVRKQEQRCMPWRSSSKIYRQIAKAKAEEEATSATKERKGKEEKETSLLFSAAPLDDEHIASVIRSAEDEVQMLLPHVKEAEQFMQLFGRDYLTFDVSLQRSQGDAFEVAASVQVRNERTGQGCYLSSFEFLEQHSIFKDEVAQLQAALDNGREYMVSEEHDPSLLLLQGTHQLGAATLFTEPIVYMMATEDEERFSVIKNVRAPYGEVGMLESSWHPLVLDADGRAVDPEADDGCDVDLPEIDSPKDLIGLPWAYRFEIKAGYNLPLTCASAYCQYELLGETFTTETVQPDPASNSPTLNYSFVHRVDKVTPEVVDQLSKPLNVYFYVGPHVEPEKPEDTITTKNPGLSARFESLYRPITPVPTASPAGRGDGGRGNPNPSRGVSPIQHRGSGGMVEGADLGAPSSWGFAAADFAENASLKKELHRARAEIKRLTKEARGGNAGIQAPGGSGSIDGGGGVATSASTGALEDGRQKGVDGVNAPQVDGGGRKGRKSRSPRESRSRRKINDAIDTARVTDAVVEAAVGGGLADPLRPDSGRSNEVG